MQTDNASIDSTFAETLVIRGRLQVRYLCDLMADAILCPTRNHDRLHVPCNFVCDLLSNLALHLMCGCV
jgi:hypothetical protein